ncbi:unnamed protein product [Ilex paraguariensis]|uniref:ZPR1 jelly-roll domain-containing protein n=1 Tax=Ilex paraguariensis TaxID=185542 RepID=A0ABC8T6E4_9AQUA
MKFSFYSFLYGVILDAFDMKLWGKEARHWRHQNHQLLNVAERWTLIIDDALANSFVAPATDDIKDDQQLTSEEYERSWEQNEELGLNDMDTSSADAAYNSLDWTLNERTDG